MSRIAELMDAIGFNVIIFVVGLFMGAVFGDTYARVSYIRDLRITNHPECVEILKK